jgi:hypothetical protein
LSETPKVQDPRKFFIAYKDDSGLDFADHLHSGLHERGVDAFFAAEDLENGLSAEDWDRQRNKAVRGCDILILVVTDGINQSKEVQKELRIAKNHKKTIKVFVEEPLKDNEEQLNIPLNSRRTLNLNKFQLIFFTTPQSLLRAVRLKIPLIRTQKIS